MHRLEATWYEQLRRREDGVRDATVLVACSGGGDSVALLAFLHALRPTLNLELVVAHADHGLRPEAEADAAFVRELCRTLDLELVEAGLDVRAQAAREGCGLETAARDLRWAWLRAEAQSTGATVVATGHTLDDHTETVLLRLLRNGGTGALTPLPARQGLRWSPLVEARRLDLRTYLTRLGLPWREDATNAEGFTPRNRLRPLLEPLRAEAPCLDRHLWETHQQVAELLALRDQLVEDWRGGRWELEAGALHLGPKLDELQLRHVLVRALPALGVDGCAELVRDLARWLAPLLNQRSVKPKTWGGWRLNSAPSRPDWRILTPPRASNGQTGSADEAVHWAMRQRPKEAP